MKNCLKSYPAAVLLLLLCTSPVAAAEPTITTLLEAVAAQPDMAASALGVKAIDTQLQQAYAELYPKVSAFGSYTRYNSPTNLRPMAPTEVNIAAGDSIPFSEQIARYGLQLEMPVFVKSLYTLADKVKQLQKASRAGHKLRLVTRQAAVVALDASLAFNAHLDKAIASRLDSLHKTRDDLQLAVDNGRTPESELLKVKTLLNDLQKQRNDLQRQATSLTSQIEQLTGIRLNNFVPIDLQRPVLNDDFIREKQQIAKVAAAEKGLQQAKEQRYPVLKLEGVLSENSGNAYNTDQSIDRSYNYVGVKLALPLFNRSLHTAITQADIQLRREKRQLSQLQIDLATTAENLRLQLPIIGRSTELAQTSLNNNQQLLDIAKVAFRNGRMTTEEYLRFETQVLDAEAALHKTHVDRWQIISQQAVLYGDDLTGVVQ
ncbi:MAG: TolC family protein [Desulfuromusa sp.]